MRHVRRCASLLVAFFAALISPAILIYSMPFVIGAVIDLMQIGKAFVERAL
jgi:hypothetical protein